MAKARLPQPDWTQPPQPPVPEAPALPPQEQPLELLPDDEVERMAEAANEAQADLVLKADLADTQARAAATVFTNNPTGETLAAREISAQLALNARTAANDHALAIEPYLAEASRRQLIKRDRELTAVMDLRGEVSALGDELVAITERYRAETLAVLKRLHERLLQRQALIPEANAVKDSLGLSGGKHGAVSIGSQVHALNAALGKAFGHKHEAGMAGAPFTRLNWWMAGGESRTAVVDVELRIPLPTDHRIA